MQRECRPLGTISIPINYYVIKLSGFKFLSVVSIAHLPRRDIETTLKKEIRKFHGTPTFIMISINSCKFHSVMIFVISDRHQN